MRATIDLDNPAVSDVIEAWDTLTDHGDGLVKGRTSSSGTGVHLKVHGCSEPEAAALRLVCGDDAKRRRFDRESSLKPKQILFSSKGDGREAGEWSNDPREVIEEYERRAPPAYLARLVLVSYPVLRETEIGLAELAEVIRS